MRTTTRSPEETACQDGRGITQGRSQRAAHLAKQSLAIVGPRVCALDRRAPRPPRANGVRSGSAGRAAIKRAHSWTHDRERLLRQVRRSLGPSLSDSLPASHAVSSGLRVVVLTCGELGFEVASRLVRETRMERGGGVPVAVAPTEADAASEVPVRCGPHSFLAVCFTLPARHHGRSGRRSAEPAKLEPAVSLVEVDDFHSAAAREKLHALRSDLGVVVGTYVLRDGVYDIPRSGSINLHSGKTPALPRLRAGVLGDVQQSSLRSESQFTLSRWRSKLGMC